MSTFDLFGNPPTSSIEVLKNVFEIFRSHWIPLISISILKFLSLSSVTFLLNMVAAVVLSDVFEKLSPIMSIRHLSGKIASSISIDGLSRHLGYYDSEDSFDQTGSNQSGMDTNTFDPNALMEILGASIVAIILMFILYVVVLSLVSCIFTGAMIHATADVYTDDTPTVTKSIGHGWTRKWSIMIYYILYSSLILAMILVLIGIPAILKSPGLFFLGYLALLVAIPVIGLKLVCAIPAIVVESESPTSAFKRSWNLCTGHTCFIFCTYCTISGLLIVTSIILSILASILPDVITSICIIFIYVLLLVCVPITTVVLYVSIRIRSENYSQETLRDELMSDVPGVNSSLEFTKVGPAAEVV